MSDQTSGSGSSFNDAVESIFSYNGNVMLAAVISLLLVILFVLLLHLYAKWFLAQARQRRRRNSLSVVLGPNRLHHFHTFSFDSAAADSPPTKGLDASAIASIPLFVYSSKEQSKLRQECVICLSGYEDGDIGRNLAKCGHDFHVECIDMWLQSHSSCPICRSPVVSTCHDSDGHDQRVDEEQGIAIDEVTVSSSGQLEIVIENVRDQDRSGDPESESDGSDVITSSPSCSCLSQLPAPAPAPAMTLGSSLKRMVSCKNKSERKVHPSTII